MQCSSKFIIFIRYCINITELSSSLLSNHQLDRRFHFQLHLSNSKQVHKYTFPASIATFNQTFDISQNEIDAAETCIMQVSECELICGKDQDNSCL